MPGAIFAIALLVTVALVRLNFIAIRGHVFRWQVSPILARGKIGSLRDYRAALYFVEQTFESGGFNRAEERAVAERLNHLLADFYQASGPKHPESGSEV